MKEQALQVLEDAVGRARRDSFDIGTVVRWESVGIGVDYLYAAMKTPVGWFTTAREYNTHVSPTISFEDLLEILGRSETKNVAVSVTWQAVGAYDSESLTID